MGDVGALMLGLLMAVSTSVVGGRADPQLQGVSGQTYFFIAPLFIPLLILGVPFFDVLFAILRRTVSRQGFATADRGHLHHRLIALGHGPRRAVVILWAWTALLSTIALYPALISTQPNFWPLVVAAVLLAGFTVFHPRWRPRADGE
jgi:UDP-GlcNAc:undecaprenyl-phosphate GlcNAc-1-phosphate transferase